MSLPSRTPADPAQADAVTAVVADVMASQHLKAVIVRVTTGTPDIPGPVLHSYTSERRYALGIPATTPFYEDSTYWNPSWTITHGAIETTNIYDLNATAVAIGTGRLLSPASYQKMITKDLIGKTTMVPGCLTCIPQQAAYTYGLGIVSSADYLWRRIAAVLVPADAPPIPPNQQ